MNSIPYIIFACQFFSCPVELVHGRFYFRIQFYMSKGNFEINFEDRNLSFCLSEESGIGQGRRRKRLRVLVVSFLSQVCSEIRKS